MPHVTIAAALVAGMLSFLSPCVLPLVPPYLVYLTGTSLERFADAEAEPRVRRETLLAAFLFVLGFSTVFVALGAGASAIGAVLRAYSGELAIAAGIIIVVMGLHFLGLAPIGLLMRQKRLEVAKPVGLWGAYLMGLAFAFGWTPCIGPILAAILAVAASEETVAKGAGMLAVYSLGLGVPFIAAAFAVEPFAAFLARFRAHLGLVEKAMGGLLVLTGIAFLTGAVTQASFWLMETFPVLGKIGLRLSPSPCGARAKRGPRRAPAAKSAVADLAANISRNRKADFDRHLGRILRGSSLRDERLRMTGNRLVHLAPRNDNPERRARQVRDSSVISS
jgi:cytochrome c-type biogenesis protein